MDRCLDLTARLLFVLALLLTAARAPAASPCKDTPSCLQVINERQQQTHSVSARFTQTKYLSLMNEPLVSHGSFAFKQPEQVLWKIDDPPLTIRIGHDGLHVDERPDVDRDLQAMSSLAQLMRQFSGMFTGSLQGLEGSFEITATGSASEVTVRLKPKAAQLAELFHSIVIIFGQPDLTIAKLSIDEALGDRLEIVFSDVHRNDAIADAAISPGGRP